MSQQHNERKNTPSNSNWITVAESECLRDIENEPSTVSQELDNINHILWMDFQDSAKFTAALYKDRSGAGLQVWYPFQSCATAITRLYKDSLDAVERAYELGQQAGNTGCRRDTARWAKRKRRKVNRLELFKYLSRTKSTSDNESDELSGVLSTLGMTSPHSPRQSTSGEGSRESPRSRPSPPRTPPQSSTTPDLHSLNLRSRKMNASSLFDEFLECVHSQKRSRPS